MSVQPPSSCLAASLANTIVCLLLPWHKVLEARKEQDHAQGLCPLPIMSVFSVLSVDNIELSSADDPGLLCSVFSPCLGVVPTSGGLSDGQSQARLPGRAGGVPH